MPPARYVSTASPQWSIAASILSSTPGLAGASQPAMPITLPPAPRGTGYALSSLRHLTAIPIEHLFALPEHDARFLLHVIVNRFEILYPMGHAADVRMHRNGHDARGLLTLLIQAIELIAAAIE